MRWLLRNLRGLSFVIALLVASTLLYRSYQNPLQEDSWLPDLVLFLASPFQKTTHWVSSSVEELLRRYVLQDQVYAENQRLREQVASLQTELNQMREASARFDQVLQELEWVRDTSAPTVYAEIIGTSTDPLTRVWWLNRGRDQGVEPRQPVVVAAGVVGRVQHISSHQAMVQLIVDQRSRFPAMIQRSRARGIVVGTGDGLELRQVLPREDIQVGDRVVTSGLSQLFPKGLSVGIVTEVRREEHELFQTAVLAPAADFGQLEAVAILPVEAGLFQMLEEAR